MPSIYYWHCQYAKTHTTSHDVEVICSFVGYQWLRWIASKYKLQQQKWEHWIASKYKLQQQKWEHSPFFTSGEIIWSGVWRVDGEMELAWHISFPLTPVDKYEIIELLLSSMEQFHTVNILTALLKRYFSLLLCKSGLLFVAVQEWWHLAYQCSEMSSGSSNNHATWDIAIAACVSSEHTVTGTRSRGWGFATCC